MIFQVSTSILIIALCIAPSITAAAQSSSNCNQTCVGSGGQAVSLPFPFGFSSGCPIRLNCSANGTALVGEFPVQNVTSDSILVKIPAQCGRSIETIDYIFTSNYAPTWQNGILMQNCTSSITGCLIPSTTVQTHFDNFDCAMNPTNKSNNISCFSPSNQNSGFIDYVNLTSRGCGSLFSAISTASGANSAAVMLEVQVVDLGWWLEGGCSCSENANCTVLTPPGTGGGTGYRCQCSDGFVGDGYRDGLGCSTASSACDPSGQCDRSNKVGDIIAGIAGGAALIIGVCLLCWFILLRCKSKNGKKSSSRLFEAAGISIPIYPYSVIEKATNSFSEKQQLGTGAYGTVYAGKLNKKDEWVAIKRIRGCGTETTEQVLNEIKLLSSVSHPHLVRLLGCCIEKGEQILIYEFMPNGTLYHHLQGDGRNDCLKWPVRLKIASETAQAIAFLHSAMNPPIYHRDVKSSNILLDNEFRTKVADFGLSRLGLTESSHISTAPQGTPGYLDPQYHQNFHLSDKSDVYSFGVVLAEMITGLKAVDFTRPRNDVNLASLATDRIAKGRFEEIIDPALDLQMDEWNVLTIHKVAELAFRCLAYESATRPSMMEVAYELEQIGLCDPSILRTEQTEIGTNSRENKRPYLEEINVSVSSGTSSYFSSFSSTSERRLSMSVKKLELLSSSSERRPSGSVKKPESLSSSSERRPSGSVKKTELASFFSPVFVQDPWVSEQISHSSRGLLSHAVQ